MLFWMTVTVVEGTTVTVVAVAPTQEQALLYRTEPEQAEAYAGMLVGVTVIWWFANTASRA